MYNLKMSECKSTAVRDCKPKKEGGVSTPETVMVKRKSESYELLPDHRLSIIISIVLRTTRADRFSVTHTSLAHIICMGPGHNA